MHHPAATLLGLFLFAITLLDAFQTIILPRRPVGRLRVTRLFFVATWTPWAALSDHFPRRFRDQALSIYGPLSLLLLMVVWALILTLAFGLVFFGIGAPFAEALQPVTPLAHFVDCMYVSGTTLFTLGLGDVLPTARLARALIVLEAGVGLAFVAMVIGYVPVLYGAFSRREVSIALLDARAGSPPTAGELLLRHNFAGGAHELTALLAEWERWAAEMLESHVSYPILCYYRSQHDNQSWLSSITAVLDACALLITTVEGPSTRQAQLTFAIARHTLVDLGHVFHRDERIQQCLAQSQSTLTEGCGGGRLSEEQFGQLCTALRSTGFNLCASDDTRHRLAAIRLLYEPHARALADYLRMDLPLWLAPPRDLNRRPDPWTAVNNLRAAAITQHVSSQSTASSLNDDLSHPF